MTAVDAVLRLRTCPGKMSDFQLRPLSASTDAVERPKRPEMSLIVSPSTTRYSRGARVWAGPVAAPEISTAGRTRVSPALPASARSGPAGGVTRFLTGFFAGVATAGVAPSVRAREPARTTGI